MVVVTDECLKLLYFLFLVIDSMVYHLSYLCDLFPVPEIVPGYAPPACFRYNIKNIKGPAPSPSARQSRFHDVVLLVG